MGPYSIFAKFNLRDGRTSGRTDERMKFEKPGVGRPLLGPAKICMTTLMTVYCTVHIPIIAIHCTIHNTLKTEHCTIHTTLMTVHLPVNTTLFCTVHTTLMNVHFIVQKTLMTTLMTYTVL